MSEGDRIDLHKIDANTKIAGNQAFHFISAQNFHHKAGELHFVSTSTGGFVEGDVNGDGKADFQIELDPFFDGLAEGRFHSVRHLSDRASSCWSYDAIERKGVGFGRRPFLWLKIKRQIFRSLLQCDRFRGGGYELDTFNASRMAVPPKSLGYVVILSLVFGFLGFRDSAFFLALSTVIFLKALSWARSRTAEKSD